VALFSATLDGTNDTSARAGGPAGSSA